MTEAGPVATGNAWDPRRLYYTLPAFALQGATLTEGQEIVLQSPNHGLSADSMVFIFGKA